MANFNLENYVPVHERLAKFYRDNPDGRITTSIIDHDREKGFVLIQANVYRTLLSDRPAATGHAFEERSVGYVNKTSYIENAETSAVGRALALMGYEIARGLASREEMDKVQRYEAVEQLTVVRQNGHYRVNGFKVSKPNGTVECNCGTPRCAHIEAVRAFATAC
ncbi:MAG: hypothetical protein AAB288_04255 [Acidobacteriota bacterium]